MPFGIPASQDEGFDTLITGVQDNTADLTTFGQSANKALQAGIAANQADLSRPVNRLSQQLTRAQKANAKDLDQVAQSMALSLAAGAQANAADLARGTSAMAAQSLVPGHYAIYLDKPPGEQSSACHYKIVLYGNDPGALPAIDPETGYFLFNYGYGSNQEAIDAACPIVSRAECGPAPAECSPTGNGPPSQFPVWFIYRVTAIDQPCTFQPIEIDSQAAMDVWLAEVPQQGIEVLGGPFSSAAAANAAGRAWINAQPGCAPIGNGHTGNGTICPPCDPCPPPVDCPPCDQGGEGDVDFGKGPDVACPSFDLIGQVAALWDIIPSPGSADFCSFLALFDGEVMVILQPLNAWLDNNLTTDALRDWLRKAGDQTEDEDSFLAGVLQGLNPLGGVLSPTMSITKTVFRFILKTLQYILDYAADYLDAVFCAFKEIRDRMMGMRFRCGSPSIIALMLVKWLLGAFRDWQLGTDALVWAVDWVHVDFGPFERFLDLLITWALPMEIASAPEATRAWMMGQIGTQQRDCVWRLNGFCPDTYVSFALAESEHLTADELIRYGHRVQMPDEDIDRGLRQRGWVRDEDRNARRELFWEIPTIQDHLHWLQRNVDDIAYVQRFGLLDGFSSEQFIRTLPGFENYQIVVDPHGRDFWRAFGGDLTAQGMRPQYAAFHYAAHWIQPSPEQMREFVYRLRPGAPGMTVSFTVDDFERILTEQDYAPLARQWFKETVYRIPATTYIIGMYRANVIDDEGLKNYHQDLGYTATDSDRFVGVDRIVKNRMRANEYRGWNPTAIANAYSIGKLSDGEVRTKLRGLGSTEQEATDLMAAADAALERNVWMRARSRLFWRTATRVTQAISTGIMDADTAVTTLTQLGYPDRYARGVVEVELAAGRTKLVQQTVASVKRAFHDGYIVEDTARGLLGDVGIIPAKRDEYLAAWNIQNTPRRKRRTASQIVTDLSLGMMDVTEALMRLYNLGYDQADSMLYLADAQRKVVQRQARAQAAAQQDARRQAGTLARLARQAERQARQLRSDLERIAPRSTLIKWLKKGIIPLAMFRTRMERLGYPDDDISRYIADAPTTPTVAELQQLVKAKVMDERAFRLELARLGFGQVDINYFARAAFPPATTAPQTPTQPTAPASGTGGGGTTPITGP